MKWFVTAVTAVMMAVAVMMFAPAAQAVDTSVGVHVGLSNPNLGCSGCDGLSAHNQRSYGVELRAFYPIQSAVSIGAELAYDNAGNGDVKVEGIHVANVRNRAWSVMPMARVAYNKLSIYAGVGVAQPRITLVDEETGERVSDTDRVALMAKAGAEYRLTGRVGAYAQWQYLKSGHDIEDMSVDYSQHALQAGLAYHF